MITKEMLEKRLEELKAGKEQAINNANAHEGAIQDCLYWLSKLEKEDNG